MDYPRSDFNLNCDNIQCEILDGLSRTQKELPSKLFYDECGSHLFDQICELDEYYITRTEIAIMREHVGEMAMLLGPRGALIEYGSGSSIKTRVLLDHLQDLAAYLPIDISKEHLLRSSADLARVYPEVEVHPVCADYTSRFEMPPIRGPVARRIAYFSGSTIGNFHPGQAITFLSRIAETVAPNGCLLIGVDLKKDPAVLDRAYDDRKGVTAAFNLNMLARINREYSADFRVEQFRHRAFYNVALGRIEMHLISQRDQVVHLDGTSISFRAGESILTEVSYKYTVPEFARLVKRAGFDVRQVWTDPKQTFSVQYLVVRGQV